MGFEFTGLWLAGNESMERNVETTRMGFIGTIIRILSIIPSYPKASLRAQEFFVFSISRVAN